MRVERLETLTAMQALEPEWAELWRRCPRATPFQSPQWLLPWTRHLFQGGEIQFLALREGDRLIGLAPFFVWGTDCRTVSFLGAGISDYGDLLFDPGREADCVSAVRHYLSEHRQQWDAIDLQELRAGSGLLEGTQPESCSICPVLELSAWPGGLDPKHRIDVRRARNKLYRTGDVTFTIADPVTFSRHFDEFVRLHNARWSGLDEPLQRFHREAAASFLDSGNLRLSVLWLDGAALAAIYAFTSGSTLYCYLSGFDPEKAPLSPGAVLLGWVIDQAVAEGMAEVDFLRNTERYKYLQGARDRINHRLRESGLIKSWP